MKHIKPAWEIIKWCEEHGYRVDSQGNWTSGSLCPYFIVEMHKHCDTPIVNAAENSNILLHGYEWRHEWLIDKPDPLTHEDVMTGSWWYQVGVIKSSPTWRQMDELNERGYLIDGAYYTLTELSKLPRSKCPRRKNNEQ